MRRNDPIANLMTKKVSTVQRGQKPSEARQQLVAGGFHHLPVLDGQKLVGIISANDFLKFSLKGWGSDDKTMDALLDQQVSLEALMTPDPITVTERSTVRDAAQLLNSGSFHSLPVVDGKGQLVGLVTSTDLIQYLSAQY
jgi:CBS domain-containing protein